MIWFHHKLKKNDQTTINTKMGIIKTECCSDSIYSSKEKVTFENNTYQLCVIDIILGTHINSEEHCSA